MVNCNTCGIELTDTNTYFRKDESKHHLPYIYLCEKHVPPRSEWAQIRESFMKRHPHSKGSAIGQMETIPCVPIAKLLREGKIGNVISVSS
jgi:hypothetical protein